MKRPTFFDRLLSLPDRAVDAIRGVPGSLGDYLGHTRGIKRYLPLVMGFICVFCCSFGSALFVCSSFDLPARQSALALFCAAASVFFILLSCLGSYGIFLSAGMLACTGFILLRGRVFAAACRSAFAIIWWQYEKNLNLLSADELASGPAADCSTTRFLAVLAVLVALLTALCAMRGHGLLAVLAVLVLLCTPCLYLFATPPDALPAVIMCSGAALLLLTRNGCRADSGAWGLQAAILLLPVAMLFALLCLLNPPNEYQRAEWPDRVVDRITDVINGRVDIGGEAISPGYLDYGFWEPETESVDLTKAGPQGENNIAMLDIRTQTSGTMYLRAVSLARYADSAWSELPGGITEKISSGTAFSRQFDSRELIFQLTVRPRDTQTLLLLPYYSVNLQSDLSVISDAYVRNPNGSDEYSISYQLSDKGYYAPDSEEYSLFVYDNYLELPEGMGTRLAAIAASAGITGLDTASKPQAVADYLRTLAVYDLRTPLTPEGEDFVLYFLEQSHRGYCVHFASAGALLLRSQGIPTRYCTGYLAQTVSNVWVNVDDNQAHAWVEYYTPDEGWRPLECTPSSGTGATGSATTTSAASVTATVTTAPSIPASGTDPSGAGGTTAPGGSVGQTGTSSVPPAQQTDAGSGGGSSALWLLLLIPPLAAGGLYLRRVLWESAERRARTTGGINRQVLGCWKRIERLSRTMNIQSPDELYDMALKARFSQHELAPDELDAFEQFEASLIGELSAKSGALLRLYHRYWLLLY